MTPTKAPVVSEVIDIHDAQAGLSDLVGSIENGSRSEIVITRTGRPVARLVPIAPIAIMKLGVADGQFSIPDDMDVLDAEIEKLFR